MFSGRRGIHCWVCDKTARHLDNKNRNAVAEYLNLFTQQNSANRVTIVSGTDRMHHSLNRASRICAAHFDEICLNDQNLFGSVDGRQKLLDLITDDETRKELEPKIMAIDDSHAVWGIVKKFVESKRNQRKVKFLIEEIQMSMLCPRLDISVSKTANHLLKAPFCVHPKTGKVCVPFHPSAVSKFDPTTVPTIRQLLTEIDQFDEKDKEDGTEKNRISLVNFMFILINSVIKLFQFDIHRFNIRNRLIERRQCTRAYKYLRNFYGNWNQALKLAQNWKLAMQKWNFKRVERHERDAHFSILNARHCKVYSSSNLLSKKK